MKKGFILALLMVAMVALVLPVSARAPIVNNLPTIIIGDGDDDVTSGTVQVGIMRYTDALDLLDPTKIDWNNPVDLYPADLYHAYLVNLDGANPDPEVLPYNEVGIIDVLTTTEYANLLATQVPPAASARITTPSVTTSQTLSLFNATRHPGLLDPMGASPAVDGVALSTYTAETTMLFVAAVEAADSGRLALTDGGTTSTTDSVSELKVICQSGGNDGREAAREVVENPLFEGSVEGWTYSTLSAYPYPASIGGTGETGIGFNVTTVASGLTHASWASPADLSGSSSQAGKVYRRRQADQHGQQQRHVPRLAFDVP